MNVRYLVDLNPEERGALTELTRKGTPSARTLKRAQILLMSDEGRTLERARTKLARAYPLNRSESLC